jgi:hypothetical protein
MLWVCVSAGSVLAQASGTSATTVKGKPTIAIGYTVGGASTEVDLIATGLIPEAKGKATVQARQGVTKIEVKVKRLALPMNLSPEFLTYVLWAVSPDGLASSVGELEIDQSGDATLQATTQLQTFSLFVTAEPYFAVRQPSEVVVLENVVRKNTQGRVVPVSDYRLMMRAEYAKRGNPLGLSLDLHNVPLALYEARNAVEIAREHGATSYAPEIFIKAERGLQLAENALERNANTKEVVSQARSTVQFAEDARALAVQRQEEKRTTSVRPPR